MSISQWAAENIWYVQIGITFVSIINFPVNLLQFILISKIAFPGVSMPAEVPWWVFMFGFLSIIFLTLWILGRIYTKKDFVKHQTAIANRNNPQMQVVLDELAIIKARLPPEASALERIREVLGKDTSPNHMIMEIENIMKEVQTNG